MSRSDRVSRLTRTVLHAGWATTSSYAFHYRRRDGTVQSLVHEVFDHGHGAAVLLTDPARDRIALVRQFRLAAHLAGDEPMLLEVCAGLLDADEDPRDCARRETLEECGIAILDLAPAFTLYSSPGSLTEKVFCFVGRYDSTAPRAIPAPDNGEDIETVEMALSEALAAIRSGAIVDAKTVALIQHTALSHRP